MQGFVSMFTQEKTGILISISTLQVSEYKFLLIIILISIFRKHSTRRLFRRSFAMAWSANHFKSDMLKVAAIAKHIYTHTRSTSISIVSNWWRL
jgi:hypothetical protein